MADFSKKFIIDRFFFLFDIQFALDIKANISKLFMIYILTLIILNFVGRSLRFLCEGVRGSTVEFNPFLQLSTGK